jgi:hypothetical protein
MLPAAPPLPDSLVKNVVSKEIQLIPRRIYRKDDPE